MKEMEKTIRVFKLVERCFQKWRLKTIQGRRRMEDSKDCEWRMEDASKEEERENSIDLKRMDSLESPFRVDLKKVVEFDLSVSNRSELEWREQPFGLYLNGARSFSSGRMEMSSRNVQEMEVCSSSSKKCIDPYLEILQIKQNLKEISFQEQRRIQFQEEYEYLWKLLQNNNLDSSLQERLQFVTKVLQSLDSTKLERKSDMQRLQKRIEQLQSNTRNSSKF